MSDALGTPGGVVSDEDHRLALAGLIAPQTSTLAVRTGVLHGPGTTSLVTGTAATAPWAYQVAAHHWVSTRGTADGVYLGAKEASTTVPTTVPPGSNSRIDVIWSKQNDITSTVTADSGSTQELYGVTQGTAAASPTKPSIPVGAVEIATATVLSTAVAGTSGAGVTITQTAVQTVARGADIPVRSLTERNALTQFIGLSVKRLDDGGRVERWTGSAWAAESDVPVLASIAARDAYFSGNLRAGASALVAGAMHVYDGTKWCFRLSGNASSSGDGSGNLNIAHGGGRTPTNWGPSQFVTGTPAVDVVLRVLGVSADATNLTVRAYSENADAAMASNPIAVSWWADFR